MITPEISPTFRVAVVGGGPAGFYAAEALLRSGRNVGVDMFERLPVPYGLVRFGVAPDHPKLKAVSAVFDRIAAMPGFRFFGGVKVGEDVEIAELRRHYHAIILATGAERPLPLNIPGESLGGSHSASDFVGWYNAHPDCRDLVFDLGHEVAVDIGHGNVALDVARILLATEAELSRTDIAAHAQRALAASRVREVHVVGRGGPRRAKFSEKELSEFLGLEDCDLVLAREDLAPHDLEIDPTDGAETRRIVALVESLGRRPAAKRRRCVLRFNQRPAEIQGGTKVERLMLERTLPPGDRSAIECGLVFSSIGRRSTPIFGVPYDEERGVHANLGGRVTSAGRPCEGLYVCGWSKRGASGTIGTNRACGQETAAAVLTDFSQGSGRDLAHSDALIDRLASRARGIVDFAGWTRIDAVEKARGAERGKPREKLVTITEMLAAADQT